MPQLSSPQELPAINHLQKGLFHLTLFAVAEGEAGNLLPVPHAPCRGERDAGAEPVLTALPRFQLLGTLKRAPLVKVLISSSPPLIPHPFSLLLRPLRNGEEEFLIHSSTIRA